MTAVEWFAKQVLRSRQLGFISNEKFNELLEQAKEMEKEQIVTAHYQGYRNDIGTTEVSEQYYNETYNHKSE
jgi:IS1 family transposase